MFTSICAGLVLVGIMLIILLVCFLRCCLLKRKSNSQTHHKLKMNKSKKSNIVNNVYSRNSSSSCHSSSATSSSSTSPKTNEITVSCEEEEHEKILTIDPGHNNVRMHSGQHSMNDSSNLVMTNHHFNDLFNQRNLNIYSQANFISSGSSACASTALLLNNINSANTTQTSFGNPQLNLNENSPCYFSEMGFDEQDENDFIVTTSSNLEFLKTHSLFNQTPLNFYPSLSMPKGNY